MQSLRSTLIWLGLVFLILMWLPVLGAVWVLDRDPVRYRTGYWFRRLGRLMTRVNPTWRVALEGRTDVDPRHPYVVVANHQSMADIPVISRLPWDMKWVAKNELFRVPVVGWMMRMAGDIPLDRTDRRSGARALLRAREYLHQRCSVIFFPEGTRSRDGAVGPFSEGPFSLAIRASVPVLPIAVDGTLATLPRDNWRFASAGRVRLRVLDPISTEGLSTRDASALRDRVRGLISEAVASWQETASVPADELREARTL